MTQEKSANKNGSLGWKSLTVIIAIVTLFGSVGVYAINASKEHSHPDLVRFREMEPIRIEIKAVRSNMAEIRDEVREIRKMLIQFISDKK